MADNVGYTQGDGTKIASRGVTYSGDSVQAQVVGLATFTGADDAKIITDIGTSNPLPITAPSGIAVTGALTDAELRAAAVPVSGPLTDDQLRAVELIVSDTRAAALLFQLVQLLISPAGFDRSLNRTRGTVLIESGTVTTVSAVSALTDQTNIGGRPAQMLINQTNLSAWADCVRARIT
jgi:hypothetical protein